MTKYLNQEYTNNSNNFIPQYFNGSLYISIHHQPSQGI